MSSWTKSGTLAIQIVSYIEILVQRLADHEARSQIVPWASQGRVMIVLGRKKVSDRLTTRPHAELEQNLRLSRSKKTNLVMLKRMARRPAGGNILLAAKQTFILFIYFRSFLFDSIQQKRRVGNGPQWTSQLDEFGCLSDWFLTFNSLETR